MTAVPTVRNDCTGNFDLRPEHLSEHKGSYLYSNKSAFQKEASNQ